MRIISKEVLTILEEYTVEGITEDSDLSVLGLNSLNVMKIIVAIEKYFNIRIKDEELNLALIKYPKDIIRCIENEIGRKE